MTAAVSVPSRDCNIYRRSSPVIKGEEKHRTTQFGNHNYTHTQSESHIFSTMIGRSSLLYSAHVEKRLFQRSTSRFSVDRTRPFETPSVQARTMLMDPSCAHRLITLAEITPVFLLKTRTSGRIECRASPRQCPA